MEQFAGISLKHSSSTRRQLRESAKTTVDFRFRWTPRNFHVQTNNLLDWTFLLALSCSHFTIKMSSLLPCAEYCHWRSDKERQPRITRRCAQASYRQKQYCAQSACLVCSKKCHVCERPICQACVKSSRPTNFSCCSGRHTEKCVGSDNEEFQLARTICDNCWFQCRACHGKYCRDHLTEVSMFETDEKGAYWEQWCDECAAASASYSMNPKRKRKRANK